MFTGRRVLFQSVPFLIKLGFTFCAKSAVLALSGIAPLVYQNIDTLGHQVIIALLVSMMAGCFWYVKKNQLPYTHAESQNLGALYDYVLLLGALLWHYQPRDLVWVDGIAY